MRWSYGGHLLYRGYLLVGGGWCACPVRSSLGVHTSLSVAKLPAAPRAERRPPPRTGRLVTRRGARAPAGSRLGCSATYPSFCNRSAPNETPGSLIGLGNHNTEFSNVFTQISSINH